MQIRGTVAGMYGIRQLQVKRGTVAGIYGIRRLQVKRCGRLGLGPSSRLTVAVVFQGPEQFRAKSVRGPLRRSRTYGSFRAKVHEDHL